MRNFCIEKFLGCDIKTFTDAEEPLHGRKCYFVFNSIDVTTVLTHCQAKFTCRNVSFITQFIYSPGKKVSKIIFFHCKSAPPSRNILNYLEEVVRQIKLFLRIDVGFIKSYNMANKTFKVFVNKIVRCLRSEDIA